MENHHSTAVSKLNGHLEHGEFSKGLAFAESLSAEGISSPEIQFLVGRLLIGSGRNSEAIAHLEYAASRVSIDATNDVLQLARVLLSCGGDSATKHLLGQLITKSNPSDFNFEQLTGLVDLYLIMEDYDEALTILSNCYSQYENKPNFVDYLLLLGKALTHADQLWEELEVYALILQIDPLNSNVHSAISRTLSKLSLFDDAEKHQKFIEAIDPSFKPKAIALDYFQACKSGSFETQERLKKLWLSDPDADQESRGPFAALVATDDPEFILRQNQLFAENLYLDKKKGRSVPLPVDFKAEERRIRVTYLSPDFGNHAVCHLISDLIAQHDSTQFEIAGIAIAHPDDSEHRHRVKNNFEHFFEMENDSTVDIARKVKSIGTDIAVDLAGYTRGFRTTLFHRLDDTILVNYLGYPSTCGHNQYHYLLGDHVVTPEGCDQFFTEKIIRLDCCYQANSPSRKVTESNFEQTGLPADAFVFCNFNTRQKLNLETLDAWRVILSKCNDSVLWLLDPGETMQREILTIMGDAASRVFFAPKARVDLHLGRVQHAHLFLDNFPYGAHTTASDAIFRGVPILSRSGRAFQSRVSKSIMMHAGVNDLDADNWHDFVDIATAYYDRFSADTAASIKHQLLSRDRAGHPYNLEYTTMCIEKAYKSMLSN